MIQGEMHFKAVSTQAATHSLSLALLLLDRLFLLNL
jgi:hypothetical protein